MNRKTFFFLSAFLLAVPLAGCGGSDSPNNDSGNVSDGRAVVMQVGDSVLLGDGNRLTLRRVYDARGLFSATIIPAPRSTSVDVTIETQGVTAEAFVGTPGLQQEVVVAPRGLDTAYRVRFEKLTPDREVADTELPQEDFRATLRVTRVPL